MEFTDLIFASDKTACKILEYMAGRKGAEQLLTLKEIVLFVPGQTHIIMKDIADLQSLGILLKISRGTEDVYILNHNKIFEYYNIFETIMNPGDVR